MKPFDTLSDLSTRDGVRLKIRTWNAIAASKGRVLFIHGMGEHGGRYSHIAERLNAAGFDCHALDQRGHGRSAGKRGDILHYDLLLDDLEDYWKAIGEPASTFLYAHSLGGQLLINLITQRDVKPCGAIINAPWLALTFRPHPIKLLLSKILRKLWPGLTLESGTTATMMARDLDHLLSIPEQELTHKRMSARMFHELQNGADSAFSAAQKFTTPLLLMHGDADPVTSFAASEAFFANVASADKTLRIYPGMLHETHNEPEREMVLSEAIHWLENRAGS